MVVRESRDGLATNKETMNAGVYRYRYCASVRVRADYLRDSNLDHHFDSLWFSSDVVRLDGIR